MKKLRLGLIGLGGVAEVHLEGYKEVDQIESFARRLLRGEPPEVTGIDGLKALQVILAAYESFETQRIVPIKSII